MAFSRILIDRLATTLLADEGIAIIWRLHVDAAIAHRAGHSEAAAAVLEIAEAAEQVFLGTAYNAIGQP